MMSRLLSVVKQHPIITFFVLAFALSWWPIPFYAAGLVPATIVGFGPFLAALVVLAVAQGKTGVVGLLRRIVRWRVGFRWYAVALGLPVVISGAAAALNVLLFGAQASSAVLSGWTGLFSTFALLLLIPGIGGSWEEPGWRGYALPRLQAGRSALSASLILGVVWASWHLPLMVIGEIQLTDPVVVVAWTVVFTWLFNNTGGSVLLAMLMHNMNNVVSGGFFSAMFSGADWVSHGWLLAVLWCAVAILVVIVAGPAHLSRKHAKQVEVATEPEAAPPEVVKPTPV
jgi:membrane protease YdiL (CAAX protease family)